MSGFKYVVAEKTYRACVDQPYKHQSLHYLHGRPGIIVNDTGKDYVRIYYAEGSLIAISVPRTAITKCRVGNPNWTVNNLKKVPA